MKSFKFSPVHGDVNVQIDPRDPNRRKISFYSRAIDLPGGIPRDGNPREPNTKSKLMEGDVLTSLKDATSDLFHIKNRGLTLLCEKIEVLAGGNTVLVHTSEDPSDKNGVVDGNNTYNLILENKHWLENNPDCCVAISVLHGIEKSTRTPVTVAMNRSVAVTKTSEYDHLGYFDDLKKMLSVTGANPLRFRQNEKGGSPIVHVVELLYTLRKDKFPTNMSDNEDRGEHPAQTTVTTSENILVAFGEEADRIQYNKFENILGDVLQLYDYIEGQSEDIYSSRKQSMAPFIEGDKTTFFGYSANNKLHRWSILPMVAGFRYLIEEKNNKYEWKVPFENVKALYRNVCKRWMSRLHRRTESALDTNGIKIESAHELAKDRSQWTTYYDNVEIEFLNKSSDYLTKNMSETDFRTKLGSENRQQTISWI